MILPSKLPWSVEIDGADLVVRNVKATCFGGRNDSGDNGKTQSGISNDGRYPALMGVALPIRSLEAATRDSPLAFPGAHIPWFSTVMVWREQDGEQNALATVLIDNGPDVSRYPDHALDCNPNVALHFSPFFDPQKLANGWAMDGMSYRIIGAARFAITTGSYFPT